METVTEALLTVEKLRYGAITPEIESIETIANAHEILEQQLKTRCKRFKYFITRRVLLIIF